LTPRERVLACLNGQTPDEVPMRDAPLPWALERWEKEGMQPGGFPAEFFDNCIDGTGYDESLRLPDEVLEDDGRARIVRTSDGVTCKVLPGSNSTPHCLDWAIKTRADWDRVKDRLVPNLDRVPQSTLDWLTEIGEKRHAWSCIVIDGFFGRAVSMVGIEQALEMTVADPEWALDIYTTVTDFNIGMIELVRQAGVRMDGVYYADDVAFKNGPLVSPRAFRELMAPNLARVCEAVHSFGGHLLYHTDGLMTQLIPAMIEAGVDIIDPLEVKAGMDLAQLRQEFGRAAVWEGNIDATVLYYGTKRDIETEVKKKLSVFSDGGYIYRVDGPITDEASLENYRWLIDCVQKYGSYS
jgi:uroporphyrinogen decarboxylase